MVKQSEIEVQVHSNPRLLHAVRALVRGYVSSQGFEHDVTESIVLAVDEACANSMRHAYGGDLEEAVFLSMDMCDAELEIVVRDNGRPMPAGCWNKRIEEPPEDLADLKPGGLGFPLMHAVFDTVEVLPGEMQGNLVRLRLHRPDQGRA